MQPQSGISDAGEHVIDRLDDYYIGALPTIDEVAIDAHLLQCSDCRAEYDELGTVALLVASQPPGTLEQHEQASAGDRAPLAPVLPGSEAPQRPTVPGRPRHSRATHRGLPVPRARWNPRRVAAFAAAVVLGAILGIGGQALIDYASSTSLRTASDSDDGTADRLSVTLVAQPGASTVVQAAAVGLQPGRVFRLLAVGTDGRSYIVFEGVADGGIQSIVGTVAVAAPDIAFVVLAESGDGALLVTRID